MRWYFWMAYNKNCHFWNCLCPQAPILPLAISLYFSCKNQHFVNSWIKLIKSQEKYPIFSYLYNKNVCYMYLGKCFFKNFCIIWKLKHYLMISSARQWISLQKWEIWFHCCLPIIISLVMITYNSANNCHFFMILPYFSYSVHWRRAENALKF